jgi:hypothetical protein
MARRPTGAVVEHIGRDGIVYRALRFTAYGKRRHVTLGPVSEAEAARALRHALADVERGTWAEPAPVVVAEPDPVPTFHELSEQWWLRNERQLRASTIVHDCGLQVAPRGPPAAVLPRAAGRQDHL